MFAGDDWVVLLHIDYKAMDDVLFKLLALLLMEWRNDLHKNLATFIIMYEV